MVSASPLPQDDRQRLDALYAHIKAVNGHMLGYPCAKNFDYSLLYRFLEFPLNNIGDPFQSSTYQIGSRELEREVVDFFARLFNAPDDGYWGYVTNGGTEGNLYGLYLARELYPGGIVYFSEETHYSIAKNVHLLGMRHIMVRAQASGEIDYADLRESISFNRDAPAIVIANIGTTMKEARDDTLKIKAICDDLRLTKRYIHSDGAFCGAYAAFLDPKPAFDFTEGADSIAISGHKFTGSPIPCGVVVARKENVERIGQSIGYIGCRDTTITGSRSGFAPLLLWYAVKTLGVEGLKARLAACQSLAAYTVEALNAQGIPAWRNPQALTVVLPRLSDALVRKWQIATHDVSHLIITPGTTRGQIDAFLKDIAEEKP